MRAIEAMVQELFAKLRIFKLRSSLVKIKSGQYHVILNSGQRLRKYPLRDDGHNRSCNTCYLE